MIGLVLAAALGALPQEGEVLILEGDDEIVGEVAAGPALTPEAVANLLERIHAHVTDDFDMIVVHTTFTDALNPGAYYMPDAPTPSRRSFGFINMNQVGMWGETYAPVMAQEFSHAWLAFTTFVDPVTGLVSDELLGRDLAHWSARVDADGSFQDGVDWVDNGDGTFTVAGYMERFSPLDLWTMGFLEDAEVPDFLVLRTDEVAPGVPPPIGLTVAATPFVVTLADIIAAEGPQPPVATRQHDFRLLFVLVTDRGETAASARPLAAVLDAQRAAWTAAMPGWLWDRGTMCTEVAAACDAAHLVFDGVTLREGAGDGDGVIEPGEIALADVGWTNPGPVSATGAASLASPVGWAAPASVEVVALAPGERTTTAFAIEVPAALACGERFDVEASAALGASSWRGVVAVEPGVIATALELSGWRTDPDDTATAGGWAHGAAELVLHDGRVLQPGGEEAWWTGRERGADWKAGDLDGGITTLTSPPLELGDVQEPSVRYRLWYVALDHATTPPTPTDDDELVVEVTDDDGATWREIDRVSGAPRTWEVRTARLAGVDPERPIRLRFTARDAGTIQNLVEVGIDDVQVLGRSDDCATIEAPGCGCRGSDPSSSFGLILLLAGLAGSSIRQRRSP